MVEVVKERTTSYLTVDFKDKGGLPAAPATVLYNVYCMTNAQVLRADTVVAPGTSIEITLNATDNSIVNATNARERRRVTLKASYGANDELNDQYEYYVQNLERAP
ncbi:MAG: hypothetical protein HYX63_13355 [Gammaproteobacteria bacterium]|nr:hypothetical protein [Gammaproteobacteria bacterium]